MPSMKISGGLSWSRAKRKVRSLEPGSGTVWDPFWVSFHSQPFSILPQWCILSFCTSQIEPFENPARVTAPLLSFSVQKSSSTELSALPVSSSSPVTVSWTHSHLAFAPTTPLQLPLRSPMTSMLLNLKFLVLVFHLLCQQLLIQLMASSLKNFLYLAPRIPPPPGFLSTSLAMPSRSPLLIPPNLSRA